MSEVVTRVRERMKARGFPGTLLPDNMKSETFDPATGDFSVTLTHKVDLDVDGIPVHFASTISGNIVDGKITNLRGVKAKQTFWVSIGAILVEGADLVFKVGPLKKAVPRSAFAD